MTEETEEQRKKRLREEGASTIRALFHNPHSRMTTAIYGNNFDAQILLKLDKRLKDVFQEVCKENGVTVSTMLRDFMREYVKAYRA